MTVRFIVQRFCAVKFGNPDDEYEDASCLTKDRQPAIRSARYAVADGATTSSFAKEWADLLVKDYVTNGPIKPGSLGPRLHSLQTQWSRRVFERPLPWYAEQKARRGAFATLLGLTLRGKKDATKQGWGRWHAWALGDSCLMHVRNDILITSFPISTSAAFSFNPVLLPSLPTFNPDESFIKEASGTWYVGDYFFLMTDACAIWFLSQHEAGHRPWNDLIQLAHDHNPTRLSFCHWLDQQRQAQLIPNDDVTLLVVEVVDDQRPSAST